MKLVDHPSFSASATRRDRQASLFGTAEEDRHPFRPEPKSRSCRIEVTVVSTQHHNPGRRRNLLAKSSLLQKGQAVDNAFPSSPGLSSLFVFAPQGQEDRLIPLVPEITKRGCFPDSRVQTELGSKPFHNIDLPTQDLFGQPEPGCANRQGASRNGEGFENSHG